MRCPRAETRNGYLHRERWQRKNGNSAGGSHCGTTEALRSLPWALPWLRLDRVDGRIASAEIESLAKCAGAHPSAGRGQETFDGHREAIVRRIRDRGATPECDAYPRRCWVLSGCPVCTEQDCS